MNTFCGECGSKFYIEDLFCGKCGTKREVNKAETNEDYKKVLYSYHGITIALLSKLAKIDGRVCKKEANYIKSTLEYFSFHKNKNRFIDVYDKEVDNLEEIYKRIVKEEKNSISNISTLCSNLSKPNAYETQKTELIKKLVSLAHIDNNYSTEEENFIIKILNLIHLDYSIYKDIIKKYEKKEYKEDNDKKSNKKEKSFNGNLSTKEAYVILELEESATSNEIKKQYRKLAKQYHYDSMVSKDLPKDVIEFAEDKLKMINSAYEILKNNRAM